MLYTIKISEEQRALIQLALENLVEIDVNEPNDELSLLTGMFRDLPAQDTSNGEQLNGFTL